MPEYTPEETELRETILDWMELATVDQVLTAVKTHDKEVAARTIEGYRDLIERTTKLHDYAMDEDDWDEHKRLVAALTNYAAAIRSGSEGGNR